MKWDYKKIRKEYKKLGVPSDYFNPCDCPLETSKYFMILSERASGKTSNILLLGLILNRLYGTVIQYIRQYDIMLAPKNARDLFNVLIECGYIQKLTDGRFNSMVYKSRRWYYSRTVDGETVETAEEPVCVCLSIDNNEAYKSSYNAPTGDFIVFDEFCARRHAPDEFLLFCDLLSTIIRTRQEPIIWMLGNTIDRYEYYFDELEVADYVKFLKMGERMEVKTSKGTPIYLEFYSLNSRRKSKVNTIFFGFKNSKLNAITGEDWLVVPCQHIEKDDEREVLNNTHYLEYEKNILQIEVCHSEKYGLHCIVHKSSNIDKENITIYTCEIMLDVRYKYRFGHSKIDKMIWTLYARKKFFYATNSDAAVLSKYVALAEKVQL